MQYLGDYAEDYATLNFKFSTHKADGTPATLSGTPAISVYKANGTTQSTAGITLTADFDSVTGLNNVLIDLSADAFYAVASDYQVVITTGTVDSVSVVGTVLAHFSIENRFAEVDVTKISGDSTAADNLESACDNYSATRGLAGTALPAAAADAAGGLPISDAGALDLDSLLATLTNGTYGLSAIENLVDEIESRLTSARAGYLDNLATAPPTAAAIVDAMLDELLTGHSTPGSVGISITDTLGYVTALRSALTDLRAAALDRIVGTIAAGTHNPQSGDAYGIVSNGTYGNSALETLVDDIETALANGTYGLNALLTAIGTRLAATGYTVPPTTSQITDAVLDAPLADHLDAGSVGAGINAAGSSGDPWSTTLPGSYGAGTAGKIIGDNVNATISSRSSHSAADVWAVSVRTLSTFGTLVADIATAVWGAVARTITGGTITANSDKTGYALTGTDLADIKTVTDNLATAMTADGAVYKFTANALEEAPGGGTGGDATEAHQLDMIDKLEGLMSKDHTLATAVGTFDPTTDSTEAIRNRGDAAWITGGGVSGTYAVVINVKDALGVNILDAWVEIWDSAGTAFIEKKQTNSSGNASFNKDAGDYIIRLVKSGYSQTTAEALTISAAGTSNFVMTAFVITAPSNPELCRVYGFFLNPDGTIITGLTGNALVLTYQEDNTVYAGTEVGTYVTTGTYAGMMYFDLARGASATVTLDMINYSKAFTVPELDTEELKDL